MKHTYFVLMAALIFGACENHEPMAPDRDVDAGADTDDTGVDVGESDAPLGCVPGLTNCDNICFDLESDPEHCGTCDGVCREDEVCSEGMCQCDASETRCGLSCVDMALDDQNCGGCGVVCGAIELCQAGECVVQCDEGLTGCDGACIDTTTDEEHCGGCDIPCLSGENEGSQCEAGSCATTCEQDWYDLDRANGCEYFCDPGNPGEEVCDGEDNDCDGDVDTDDSDYEDVLCPQQDGVCAGAISVCADGELLPCDSHLYGEAAGDQPYDTGFETWCDGLDNNCSGLADESCCSLADLPVEVPAATLPIGWNDFADFEVTPFLGAPIPMAVLSSIGRTGDSIRSIVSLAFFDGAGGHGRLVQIANTELGESDPLTVLEALWNDGVVLYTRTGDEGPVTRREFDEEGTETSAEEVDGFSEFGTLFHSIRGRVLEDGTELLLIRATGSGTRAYAAEVSDGTVVRDVELTSSDGSMRLLDILPVGSAFIACVERPALTPDALRCFTLGADFLVASDEGFAAFRPSNGRTRFAESGDGWLIYLTDAARTSAVRVEVTTGGEISSTDTAIRVVQGNILTGSLPTGDPAALVAEEHFDVDPPVFETTLIKPESGGAVVASYAATGAVPLGFIYGDDATFVTLMSLGSLGEESFGRAYAFRLSQDGAALCLDPE